jgi:hypothetical protein
MNGRMMAEFKHVSGDALQSLNLLAELVYGALELAGLPAHLQPKSLSISGAEIDVDTGDDAGRGVYVFWHPHPAVADAAAERVQRRQLSDLIIERSGAISRHMEAAIINILTSAGFDVEESRDGLRPFTVRVIAGPPGGKLWFERP